MRVAIVWSGLTRGKGKWRGYLQDLFGYLVMACTSILSCHVDGQGIVDEEVRIWSSTDKQGADQQ